MFQHVNTLMVRALFLESLKKALRPGEFEMLMRRARRKAARADKRLKRHASYPYASRRQNARYARQIAAGQLKFV